MVNNYKNYIKQYIIKYIEEKRTVPGEHHFVSIYLAPKIYKLKQYIPKYINPDGMKGIIGDLIYDENDISIEIKYKTITFTLKQFNNWIKKNNFKELPKYIIGINEKGLFIQDFKTFKKNYNYILKQVLEKDSRTMGIEKYLNYCESNKLGLKEYEYFSLDDNKEELLEERIKQMFESSVCS